MEQWKRGFETAAAIVTGGGSMLIGIAVIGVLIFAGIIASGTAIALCVGGVALGAVGIGALGYLYACNATEHNNEFKQKLLDVTTQMQRVSNLMMVLVNALDLVQNSFSLIEKQIQHIIDKLTLKFRDYPNTKEVAEWTEDLWEDENKIGELAKKIQGNDSWGTDIQMMLGIAEQPKLSTTQLEETVDQAIQHLAEFEERVKEAVSHNLG